MAGKLSRAIQQIALLPWDWDGTRTRLLFIKSSTDTITIDTRYAVALHREKAQHDLNCQAMRLLQFKESLHRLSGNAALRAAMNFDLGAEAS
jgi:hypothetical protein